MAQSAEETLVPIIKVSAVEVEKFLARLRERLKESRTSVRVSEEKISALTEIEDVLWDMVSATTSDVIISPFVADQYLLTDAITMLTGVEKAVLQPAIDEFVSNLESGRVADALRSLGTYLFLKRVCLDAVVQVLKRRLTHVFVNMPPNLRPSLASASIGYEKVE